MIETKQIVPVLMNTPYDQLEPNFIGIAPFPDFQPVEPSILFSNLSDQILGSRPQAVCYRVCQLMSVIKNSTLSELFGFASSFSIHEELYLKQMHELAKSTAQQAGTVRFSTNQATIFGPAYRVIRLEFQRTSSTTYQVKSEDQLDILTVKETGSYIYAVNREPLVSLLFTPLADSFQINWAVLPRLTAVQTLADVLDSQQPAIQALINQPQHVLSRQVISSISSMLSSGLSGHLGPAAFMILLLSHYEYLHNLRK